MYIHPDKQGKQKGYSRLYQTAVDAHIGKNETQVFEEETKSHP